MHSRLCHNIFLACLTPQIALHKTDLYDVLYCALVANGTRCPVTFQSSARCIRISSSAASYAKVAACLRWLHATPHQDAYRNICQEIVCCTDFLSCPILYSFQTINVQPIVFNNSPRKNLSEKLKLILQYLQSNLF